MQQPSPSTMEVFLSPLRAAPFLMKRPKLLGLAILPIILNVLIFALIFYLGFRFVTVPLAESVNVGPGWLDRTLAFLVKMSLTMLLLVLSGLICFVLILPVGGPFHDLISEKIEHEMLADHPHLLAPSMPIIKGIRHAILEALRRVLLEAPVIIFILFIGFVPVLGPPTAVVLGFLNAMLLLPLDAYSYSMDRREWSLAKKRQFLRDNNRLWKPFGAALACIVLVPCNIVWFPPLAAVAATRMFCDHIIKEEEQKKLEA